MAGRSLSAQWCAVCPASTTATGDRSTSNGTNSETSMALQVPKFKVKGVAQQGIVWYHKRKSVRLKARQLTMMTMS
eukprot:CAMPEP_0185599426 /NCGR_PEP_ID=MMETSP0434-20130131/82700_1 /TAXON_ID=626734 ORGANISM="Favella taraikaensis, Strain Fe Narragansett Bay" /NCGR_SAMPLE_ID=MMETSP0434 /ASSEMBLY_ACC=CAM_ASM_000379 /LENGTH=75 /DNA_ID=CAMNT_0028228827 /DNA_START=1479 /DNA_END=1706 /DNA_ORIENTATION=-